FWGCALRGAVVVPMDAGAAPGFARRVAEQIEARLAVCSRAQASPLPSGCTLVLEDLSQAVARHAPAPFPASELQRRDTLEILFTSGTTDEPKGVVLTHGNVLANLELFESEIAKHRLYARLVHPIRFLNLVPLSHVFGQFMGAFVPPLVGGTVVFQESLNPAAVLRTLKRERITALVAVPRLLSSLKNKIESDLEAEGRLDWLRAQVEAAQGERFYRRAWRFRRIRRRLGWKFWAVVVGGAALDAETETFWRRLGVLVIQGYGLTESASLLSVNHPRRVVKGSVGRLLPGREFKLAEDGEILVRGENIAAGYFQAGALTAVEGADGWFHTGDLGALDAEGNLYFKGRKKHVIVTPEGMNVHPEDLEAALRAQPEVRDCAVVPLARDGNAEPCAALLLREGAQAAAVVERANRALAGYQKIRRWFLWPEEDFPRTATLKPRLNVIQQVARAQVQEHRAAAAPAGSLAEVIERVTGRTPPPLSASARLESDLNLSSLERVELMSALEDRYQVELDETQFTSATKLGELEALLRRPGGQATDYVYPRWSQRWPVSWLRVAAYYGLAWPATLLLARPRIRGRENLRGVSGPLLVISNHVTWLDPGLVLFALPLRLRHRLAIAMEGERLRRFRRPPSDWPLPKRALYRLAYLVVVGLYNAFPLPQQSGFRRSFAHAGEAVDRGSSVLVFPEGERTPDGRLQPFRAGIGLLATNLGIPVVPVRIDGLFELKKSKKRVAQPGAIQISIGVPQRFQPGADPAAIARELWQQLASLTEPG
ncbi:MAG: AMP-binding protein, partial [Terriglobia bacterium]